MEKMAMSKSLANLLLLSFTLILILSGCQTTATNYLGAQVERKGVVRLDSLQVDKQRWEDLYATVDYSFARQDNQLHIDGTFFFSFSPTINYTRVHDFELKLFLLDKDLLVVDYLDVATVLRGHLEVRVPFSYDLKLIDEVKAFTFGYYGWFYDEDGSGFRVWKLPKRQP